ncbi:MAG: lysine 2,3-aminomutase [Oligoflexia bacterium]|nr:lysine 2,3-aminomutase [Oligoflexia bacterium]
MGAKTNKDKIKSRISHDGGGNWYDYRWHLKNIIRDLPRAFELLGIRPGQDFLRDSTEVLSKFPLAITPYYLSLIDVSDYMNDPVFKQSFPSYKELDVKHNDMIDPLSEDKDSPVKTIVHRYPDRVLFNVCNYCSMYCRHCTRKRKVGDSDHVLSKKDLLEGVKYIKNTPRVRDVLLSGGDPLMLEDEKIDWLLGEIARIPHVEVIRLGTRMPVVLPFRITDDLLSVFRKYKSLWINSHFNHPKEITGASIMALNKLSEAGIPLGNQSVLLSGVNDCPRIIKNLVQKLVKHRVRPYYLYQCDLAEGLSHFRTPIGKGIEIMESLIGHTSGFSIPTYVVDAPGGAGKIPLTPNYIISWSSDKVILRNYEGIITTYREPARYLNCNMDCDACKLHLNMDDAAEQSNPIGIEKLLSDTDDTISLIPQNTERMKRRK